MDQNIAAEFKESISEYNSSYISKTKLQLDTLNKLNEATYNMNINISSKVEILKDKSKENKEKCSLIRFEIT